MSPVDQEHSMCLNSHWTLTIVCIWQIFVLCLQFMAESACSQYLFGNSPPMLPLIHARHWTEEILFFHFILNSNLASTVQNTWNKIYFCRTQYERKQFIGGRREKFNIVVGHGLAAALGARHSATHVKKNQKGSDSYECVYECFGALAFIALIFSFNVPFRDFNWVSDAQWSACHRMRIAAS